MTRTLCALESTANIGGYVEERLAEIDRDYPEVAYIPPAQEHIIYIRPALDPALIEFVRKELFAA